MSPEAKTRAFDTLSDVEKLGHFVEENGPKGSKLVKSFRLFKHAMGAETVFDELAMLKVAHEAAEAWGGIGATQQRQILNGWKPDVVFAPSSVDFIRQLKGYSDNEVCWCLRCTPWNEGGVHFFAGYELCTWGTEPVEVSIKYGCDKQTVLRALRTIAERVEQHWNDAIALDGRNGLVYDAAGRLA